jgi:uncharacterized paraquat-inducible protein A
MTIYQIRSDQPDCCMDCGARLDFPFPSRPDDAECLNCKRNVTMVDDDDEI